MARDAIDPAGRCVAKLLGERGGEWDTSGTCLPSRVDRIAVSERHRRTRSASRLKRKHHVRAGDGKEQVARPVHELAVRAEYASEGVLKTPRVGGAHLGSTDRIRFTRGLIASMYKVRQNPAKLVLLLFSTRACVRHSLGRRLAGAGMELDLTDQPSRIGEGLAVDRKLHAILRTREIAALRSSPRFSAVTCRLVPIGSRSRATEAADSLSGHVSPQRYANEAVVATRNEIRTVVGMPATAWSPLVVAVKPTEEGVSCELRDGQVVSFSPDWRKQISITNRLYIAEGVTTIDRTTAMHLERDGRPDLAQIPTLAASRPKQNRNGRGFVMLDASGAQYEIEKVLVTTKQIRDYFFAPDRSNRWAVQPSWFEILGVRETSTPAEIRLAYRVRTLELKASSSQTTGLTQAQLARGLQILSDPELRRDYLALREDANHDVSFPPWTKGCLLASGEKKGSLFVVHELLRFVPHTEEKSVRMALRRFRFEGPVAVYRDPRKRILIRFDNAVLPLQWTEEWNTWAHLTLGSAKLKATFWQQTRFRRTEAGFQPTTWLQPVVSTLVIEGSAALASRFEAARAFWRHFHPHAEVVALLRARVEQESVEAGEAAHWCLSRGVRAPVDARLINWEPDYEESYYRELAARAKAVYLFRNEYLFLFDNTIVSEIPRAGHASYIFHPPNSLEAFLRQYARATRHAIRSEPALAKKTLGYCGRIPHLKETAAWIANIERTFANPIMRRATA